MKKNMNVVIMVSDGYPHKFSANNTKGEFIARGLQEAGCNVVMLDCIFGTKGKRCVEAGVSGAGISYLMLPRKNKYLAFVSNIPQIWKILKRRKEKEGTNHIMIGMTLFPFFVMLSLIAKLAGYSRSTLFHEWHTAMGNGSAIKRMLASMLDRHFGRFVELIFPISHFLEGKSERFGKPMQLLPVLGEYNLKTTAAHCQPFFTFCGHIRYLLRNKMVLDAFKLVISEEPTAKLMLVLVGNDADFVRMRALLAKERLLDSTTIKSGISQEELCGIYAASMALLVPLDPDSLQDKARFSQKIAEYVASARPIITSEVGEIPYYFKNRESAMIVPYSAEGYARGMLDILADPGLGDKIGSGGYEVGNRHFNYKTVGKKLKEIIGRV